MPWNCSESVIWLAMACTSSRALLRAWVYHSVSVGRHTISLGI
jgi:hypothetical protein